MQRFAGSLRPPFLPLQLLDRFHNQKECYIWGDAKLPNLLLDGRGLAAKLVAVDVGSGFHLDEFGKHSARRSEGCC